MCVNFVVGELEARWLHDEVFEKEMSHRDSRIVSDYDFMLAMSGQRDHRVNDVSNKLVDELHVLTDVLDSVAKRRPKGETKNITCTMFVDQQQIKCASSTS